MSPTPPPLGGSADGPREKLIRTLGLVPLPGEGGFFRETYRSSCSIPAESLPADYDGPRSAGTGIYYLLTDASFSALHRLRGDELFHFYLGDPIEQLHLRADGSGDVLVLGNDIAAGMRPQVLVPAGVWQGSRLQPGGRFALLGTTMSPGFELEDFELGERSPLVRAYPAFEEQILALTRGGS
jgi:predicted cupin superfamily sugar epimerase